MSRCGRLGYVVKVFPRLSETFVINEIRELERQGIEVTIFSLHAPPADVPHRLLADVRAPIIRVDARPAPSEAEYRDARAVLRTRLREWGALEDRLLPHQYVRLAVQLANAAPSTALARLHAHFASRAT